MTKNVKVFERIETDNGRPDFIRTIVSRADRDSALSLYTLNQTRYDSFNREIDLSEHFAPDEELDAYHAGPSHFAYDIPDPSDNNLPHPQRPHITASHSHLREFERSFMNQSNLLPLKHLLRERYGATLVQPSSPVKMTFDNALLYLTESAAHDHIHPHEQDQVVYFVESVLACEGFDTLPVTISRYATPSSTPHALDLEMSSLPITGQEVEGYTLSARHYSDGPLSSIFIHQWIVCRQICSQPHISFNAVLELLIRRGYPFVPLYNSQHSPLYHPIPPQSASLRVKDYHFSSDDYLSYLRSRKRLFAHSAIGIAAFAYGGILWRLATETIQQEGIMEELEERSFETHTASAVTLPRLGLKHTFALSEAEQALVIGLYLRTDGEFF